MGHEPRARGTSLWLMPEGAARQSLTALIRRLADRLETAPFAPHVTLLPGLAAPEPGVLDGARALASELSSLELEPSGVDGLDQHFRCLFFRIGRSPALRNAHAGAARRFGRAPDPTFDPHLSLVYGSLDATATADLTRELEPRVPAALVVRRLHVWRTEGAVREWRELAAFDLGPGGAVDASGKPLVT